MQPQQPDNSADSTPPATDQYDFIRQYGHQHNAAPGTNVSFTNRILLVVGGVVVLAVVAIVFVKIVSTPQDPTLTLLTSAAQEETELARVAAEPSADAAAQPTLDFAMTAQLGLQSDQQALLTLLGSKAPAAKILGATQNNNTDTTLTNAKANGNYDSAFIGIAQDQLNAYQQTLQQAYHAARSDKEKQWLTDAYNHAQLLLQMSKQTE